MKLYSKIEGSGKPLVILHGFLGMSDNWKTIATNFSDVGVEVHALDLRNHGRSPHSEEFSYPLMVEDLFEYCTDHQLTNIDLIGHSMGGKVAMLFAMTYPNLLNKLVIADIAPRYYKPHHQEILAALNAVDFSVKPSRSDIDETMSMHVSDFSTRQFLMKSLHWIESGQLGFRFNLDVFNRKIEEVGEAIEANSISRTPTLFLKGENSKYIQERDLIDIKHHFPNSTVETISNAGHWLHAENPTEFFEKAIGFLK